MILRTSSSSWKFGLQLLCDGPLPMWSAAVAGHRGVDTPPVLEPRKLSRSLSKLQLRFMEVDVLCLVVICNNSVEI